ncbi:T9SS type A sorting domain-containing protein [Flavobacterium inviolabile]|uniref:T9SS type A sorting domain-containing protein n=1 Tax=Flavobacterium inviolabile TaxID=2748320 RepID=UPI0015AD80DB|nr:T9SS type A sorting domain-containing protein [Flavobacterium inviolabile]
MTKNKHIGKNFSLLFLVLITFLKGYSQQKPSLGKIYDRYGKQYTLNDITINTPDRSLNRSPQLTCSSTSYFNLFFETGSGMENTSNPVHNARRLVICKVFEDLSNFITSPLTATGKKVNILVKNFNNTSAPAGVLGMASSYYIAPYNPGIFAGGILDGEMWKTIHLGNDSYTNMGNLGNFYHGEVAFNFTDSNILWHTDLTINAPGNLYDLYTVMLHEITHALGFNSFIDQNGASITGMGYYTRYDTFLRSNTNQPLLTMGSCTMYDVSFNPIVPLSILRPGCTSPDNLSSGSLNSTVCINAVKYVGTSTVPVYTPTCFEPGSSLSHFEDQLYPTCTSPYGNDAYFVLSNNINKGITKRYLKNEERKTLCDIGYNVKTTFGSSTTSSGFINYGGTACSGITVAGLNDGINADGTYTFIGSISTAGATSTNVILSGILSNDVNATSFECLQDITAAATLSATAGTAGTTINFTTIVPGLHLLRYVPVNGTQRGNITYMYVYILPLPNPDSCSPVPTACNLVMNGDFEQYSSLPTSAYQITKACGWNYPSSPVMAPSYFNALAAPNSTSHTPGVPCNMRGYQTSNNNIGNGYANIIVSKHNLGRAHLYTTLKTPLQPNTTYQLSFDASLAEGSSAFASSLQAYFSNIEVVPLNPTTEISITNTANLFTSPGIIRNTNGWDTITFNFTTTTGGEQFLYLGALNNETIVTNTPASNIPGCEYYNYANEELNSPQTFRRSYYIDNVVLIPTNGKKLELPTAICTTQKLNDLRAYLSDVPENGVFSGPGVTVTNGVYSFNASVAGVGIITIGYTFTNSNGCVTTLYGTINVTTTVANTIAIDAINDDFTSAPIYSNTGGTTISVYANDKYNGVLSSPESLSNVSMALVAPVSIAGASIDSMGAITVPVNTPAGTYVLTYSLSVFGNCNITDTATVTIVVSRANESTLPANVRANNLVRNIGQQNTNKIIIAGHFSTYNNISKPYIARLNTDLTLDPGFSYTGNQGGNGLAIQSDNKIIVVSTNSVFSSTTSCVTRLLPDGGVDPGFNVGGVGTAGMSGRTNHNGYACAIQSDGKILVGGDFYSYNGVQKEGIVRLKTDGTLDPTFNPTELNTYYWAIVQSILIQPDGKILLLGSFSSPVAGTTVKNIIRLNANGTLDSSFFAGDTIGSISYNDLNVSIFGPLTKMVLQADGKIIVVGGFTKYNGTNVKCIVRLLNNGQIDPNFNITMGVERGINDILLEPGTNKIIIAGEFTTFNGNPVKKMIRLNPNGALDSTFSIGEGTTDLPGITNNYIKALKLQSDGKIIVGGKFLTFNGLPAGNITRISGTAGFQAKVGEPEIEMNQSYSNIKVYPNPSKELFNIDLSQEKEAYYLVSIYNILGEKIYSTSLTPKENNIINLQHLATGYYLAKLENGIQTVTLKLIKN